MVELMEQRPGLRILSFERERYELTLKEHLADRVFREGVGEGSKLSPAAVVEEALSAD